VKWGNNKEGRFKKRRGGTTEPVTRSSPYIMNKRGSTGLEKVSRRRVLGERKEATDLGKKRPLRSAYRFRMMIR